MRHLDPFAWGCLTGSLRFHKNESPFLYEFVAPVHETEVHIRFYPKELCLFVPPLDNSLIYDCPNSYKSCCTSPHVRCWTSSTFTHVAKLRDTTIFNQKKWVFHTFHIQFDTSPQFILNEKDYNGAAKIISHVLIKKRFLQIREF